MAGGKVARILSQGLQIQALGFRPSSAAVQRDSLLIQGISIHVSRIRLAWYPFAQPQKQWEMDMVNRRDLLTVMGAAALAGHARPALAADTPVIEWNMHMFSSNVAKFPFSPRGTYKPDVSRLSADPLADYQAHMKAFGIDRALCVHPEPYGDDHTLVLDCLARSSPKVQGHQHVLPQG
jgi:hypothetical protein